MADLQLPRSLHPASGQPASDAAPDKGPAPATPVPGARPPAQAESKPLPAKPARKPEIDGPKGPDPTRYGDWEKGGRCIDF